MLAVVCIRESPYNHDYKNWNIYEMSIIYVIRLDCIYLCTYLDS